MGMSHEDFMRSSLAKVLTMIDIHAQFKSGKITRGIAKEKKTTRQILGL